MPDKPYNHKNKINLHNLMDRGILMQNLKKINLMV